MKSAVKILLQVGEGQQYRQNQDKQVGKTLYTERGLRDLLPSLKARYPFLKTVYSSVLKNAALRLSKAIRTIRMANMGGAPKLSTGRSFGPGNASGSRFNTMSHTSCDPFPRNERDSSRMGSMLGCSCPNMTT
ncbi:MAG: hypothetical protein AUG45_08900 [Ktedonobacter sp. 13_1_20CM_3_54_15]|nr:MAG: hypothetical protein AUG45_08900 [Ktedonobacter sp. 13_1_20CM_3_54_15]